MPVKSQENGKPMILFGQHPFNDDGSLKSPARVTAFHNGVLVENNFSKGQTVYIVILIFKTWCFTY
jgi:hypothetical protein